MPGTNESLDHDEFEDNERKIFLNKYCSYEEIRLILPSINKSEYLQVIEKIEIGIKKGVQDFLKKEGKSLHLYTSDLSRFCFDDSVEASIAEGLHNLDFLDLEDISISSEDVCKTYRMFVYNESRDRFICMSAEI